MTILMSSFTLKIWIHNQNPVKPIAQSKLLCAMGFTGFWCQAWQTHLTSTQAGYHGWGTTQRREWILDELTNRSRVLCQREGASETRCFHEQKHSSTDLHPVKCTQFKVQNENGKKCSHTIASPLIIYRVWVCGRTYVKYKSDRAISWFIERGRRGEKWLWPAEQWCSDVYGPLARYVKLWGCRERFPRPPGVSDPDMHRGTCVTHVPWCMPESLTSG